MANVLAWLLFVLGVGHIVYALVKFKAPLAEAVAAGVVGQFKLPEVRRTAFWFFIFGPLLMLAGQAALHAVAQGDLTLLRIVGAYTLATSVLGVAAQPRSPFLVALLLSSLLLACGHGLLN
jgi:hypothetical protein